MKSSAADPLDERRLLDVVMLNPYNRMLLERLPDLNLPQTQLVAGCLFQTAWNVRSERPPTHAIKDYDVFYFDDRDLSLEAEDAKIREAEEIFRDLPIRLELRNQARVHLWFRERFGYDCPVLNSTRASIDRFLIIATCIGVTPRSDGFHTVYAPRGFVDLANGILRPNPINDEPALFAAKADSYLERWPWLRIEKAE